MAVVQRALEDLFRSELAGPVLAGAQRLAAEIRARHGEAVVAVLFYGSCLRRGTTEGVLDFYAIVSGYRAAYPDSVLVAGLGRALPPNVHYVELREENLRAKYAVISLADFGRNASPASLDCRIWSRFCQPARIVWARDDATREALVRACADAATTMAERMLAWMPVEAGVITLEPRVAWALAFHETYRAELRSEQLASIDAISEADPERYRLVLRAALCALAERGACTVLGTDRRGGLRVSLPAAARERARRSWRVRRVIAKSLAIAGLFKTAFTFDDWLPYVVWKLERHGGVKIALTERQRRRPLVYAWPVIFRLLRSGVLR